MLDNELSNKEVSRWGHTILIWSSVKFSDKIFESNPVIDYAA